MPELILPFAAVTFTKVAGWTTVLVGLALLAVGVFWIIAAREQDQDEGILSYIFIGYILYALTHLGETWMGVSLCVVGMAMTGVGWSLVR